MKLINIIILCLFFIIGIETQIRAQSTEEKALRLFNDISKEIKVKPLQKNKIQLYTFEKIVKLERLAELREQDTRYLDIRFDQIEEVYQSQMFNTLSKKQFLTFMKFKQTQPWSYRDWKENTFVAYLK